MPTSRSARLRVPNFMRVVPRRMPSGSPIEDAQRWAAAGRSSGRVVREGAQRIDQGGCIDLGSGKHTPRPNDQAQTITPGSYGAFKVDFYVSVD